MKLIKNTLENFILGCCFITTLLLPSFVFAEEVPNIDGLLDAITNKNYPLIVAFGLSIFVFFIRKSTDIFQKKYVPYVVLAIGLVSGAATGIISADGIWYHGLIKGLLEGLSAGLVAMGFWSAGLKHVLKIPKEDQKQ